MKLDLEETTARRGFLLRTGLILAGGALAGSFEAFGQATSPGAVSKETKEEAEDIAAPEDLMREHGVLRRILLIYDATGDSLKFRKTFSPQVVSAAAGIIKKFIEDYHEKLEENQLFPRFEKACKLVDLVNVLREQHRAGRQLTSDILKTATPTALRSKTDQKLLAELLCRFGRMYRPHAAREDTVLFPAIRKIVSPEEFEKLGDKFEEIEHTLFGKAGFESVVEEVSQLEKEQGILDLSLFTPRKIQAGGGSI